MGKIQIPYNDFLDMKNEYLKDLYPLTTFGRAFCTKFNVNDPKVLGAMSTASARVRIDEIVEWVI